jgi:hypothetical protein
MSQKERDVRAESSVSLAEKGFGTDLMKKKTVFSLIVRFPRKTEKLNFQFTRQ